jgi:phosphoserine phosphatase RsbU/P
MKKLPRFKRPSATLQLFLGVFSLVVGLIILTGQLWITRFEQQAQQTRNLVLSQRGELSCQKPNSPGCVSFDEKKLEAAFDSDKSTPQIGSLFVPIFLIFATLALLFVRHQQQLRFRVHRLRERILEVLDLEFEPTLYDAGEFQPLEDSVLDIFKRQKVRVSELTKEIQSVENLKVAKAVREQLIPPTQFGNERIEFFTHYECARGYGGDWWGFFETENRVVIGIGDASGGGNSTAFVVAGVRSALSVIHRKALERPSDPLNPSDLINILNRAVYEMAGTKVMMTLFLGVIDLKENTLTYSNGGHNPPWIFRKSGESSFEKISLIAEGNRLGDALQNPALEEKTIELKPEDVLVLYTDGLLDNKNREGDSFGKKRARALIEANLLSGPKLCLASLVDQIHDHNQGKDLDDDVTVVVIQTLAQT